MSDFLEEGRARDAIAGDVTGEGNLRYANNLREIPARLSGEFEIAIEFHRLVLMPDWYFLVKKKNHFGIDNILRMCYRYGMNALKEYMKQNGIKAPALAKLVGCGQPEIWRLAKYPERGGRKMTAEWAKRLAPHLDVPPEALLFSDNLDVVIEADNVRPVHVRGETAAGRWFEQEEVFDDEPPMISMVLGKYQKLPQFAFRVVGNSMNRKRIHNGDFVVCVPYFEARSVITDGDIVVVERRRGHLTERTVKQVERIADGWELWPRSTDPAHQEPIFIGDGGKDGDDGTVVEVVGLVISAQTPIG